MSAAVSQTTTEMMAPSDRLAVATTGLEPDSAVALRSAFETMFSQADEWIARAKEIRVTSEDQKREMRLARESRLALREIRINAEKARKRLKEDSLRRGKAIDGICNVLKALIEPIEERLLHEETFAARAEAARKDALRQARAETLRAYGADASAFADLGGMPEERWEGILESARMAHEARIEAARQAELVRIEAERIAAEKREAERQEAIRREAERVERERLQAEENARLKREAEEREAAAKAERDRVEAERAAERAKMQAEAEAREASARVEREKAAAEKARIEAEARKAREEAVRAAAALAAEKAAAEKAAREREEAERARLEAEAEAKRAAELAPDREKLQAFAATLRSLPIPTLATKRGQAAGAKVAEQIAKMADWVARTGASL